MDLRSGHAPVKQMARAPKGVRAPPAMTSIPHIRRAVPTPQRWITRIEAVPISASVAKKWVFRHPGTPCRFGDNWQQPSAVGTDRRSSLMSLPWWVTTCHPISGGLGLVFSAVERSPAELSSGWQGHFSLFHAAPFRSGPRPGSSLETGVSSRAPARRPHARAQRAASRPRRPSRAEHVSPDPCAIFMATSHFAYVCREWSRGCETADRRVAATVLTFNSSGEQFFGLADLPGRKFATRTTTIHRVRADRFRCARTIFG
jgi:hypothetical protein